MILSIGLAMKMVALYTVAMNKFQAQVAGAEARLQAAVVAKDDAAIKAYTEEVTSLKTLVGLFQQWIQEWLNVIKDTRQLLKAIGELGRPAQ